MQRIVMACCVAAALALVGLGSAAQNASGRRLAVVFGVGRYTRGFGNLPGAAPDAEKVAAALRRRGYTGISARYADAQSDDAVTRDAAIEMLTGALLGAREEDILVLFFAGHGSLRGENQYLLFTNSDDENLPATALLVNGPGTPTRPTLESLLTQCKARRRILVLDVCRTTARPTEPLKRAGIPGGALDEGFRARLDEVVRQGDAAGVRTAVLWACSPGEASYEHPDGSGGVFTELLVHELDGADRPVGRLVADVRARIPGNLQRRQRPVAQGDENLTFGGDVGVPERRQAGETRVNAKDGAMQVWVPAGEFDMGSNDGQDVEKPVHRVRITKGFWLYQTEVTNTMYRTFVDATGHRQAEYANDARYNQPQQPVVGVDWNDAVAYLRWAGGRLPTEAQWEYAARGPQGRKYPWGNGEPTASLAVFSGRGGPAVVGSKRAGASWCGAWDLAGNVWEWCSDYYDSNYYQMSPRQDPENTQQSQYRVLRGGSWYATAALLRGASRISYTPGYRGSSLGFRGVSVAAED